MEWKVVKAFSPTFIYVKLQNLHSALLLWWRSSKRLSCVYTASSITRANNLFTSQRVVGETSGSNSALFNLEIIYNPCGSRLKFKNKFAHFVLGTHFRVFKINSQAMETFTEVAQAEPNVTKSESSFTESSHESKVEQITNGTVKSSSDTEKSVTQSVQFSGDQSIQQKRWDCQISLSISSDNIRNFSVVEEVKQETFSSSSVVVVSDFVSMSFHSRKNKSLVSVD